MNVADALLPCLREALADPGLTFTEPPVPMTGGYDTSIYAFRLNHAPSGFDHGLVLRLYREHHEPLRARWEATVHGVLADAGYPAPRVLLLNEDPGRLGQPFLIIERMPGAGVFSAESRPGLGRLRQALALPRLVAGAQARLHAIDPQLLLDAFAREGLTLESSGTAGIEHRAPTVEGQLAQVTGRVERAGLDGMRMGLRWLLEHQPPPPEQAVICHGDFHPLNVLMSGREVTGVVDWALTTVGDPAFDVASTLVLMTLGPIEPPPPAEWAADRIRGFIARGYLRRYTKLRPLELSRLRYYQALRCFTSLVWSAEMQLRTDGDGPLPTAWDRPRVAQRVRDRFRKMTGAELQLPPRREHTTP
ncbi:MAG: phosphotransferase family protein [Dehalococcoidia bacterium]